ncbi:hypothetical protein ACWC9U_21315 [Streptomyces sp. 900116325]
MAISPESENSKIQVSVVLPLIGSGQFRGSFYIGFKAERRIRLDERAALLMMASELGSATERALLNERENAITDGLQNKLLPRSVPELPEVGITARYIAASTPSGMGGDWYDVISLPGGQTGLVVGMLKAATSTAY